MSGREGIGHRRLGATTSSWICSLLTALVVVGGVVPAACATTVNAATYAYDVPIVTRVDPRGDASTTRSLQVGNSMEESGSPPSVARGASTTASVTLVATNTADDLAGAASRASSTVGPGRGPVYGTNVHTAFADEVAALGRTDLFAEVSYLNGQVVPYGTRGAVRLDVVVGSPSAPTAIWDLKTGSAALTQARIAQIQSHLPPAFQNIPVLEVRP